MLPQKWTATTTDGQGRTVYYHATRHEKTCCCHAIHQLHDDCRLEWGEGKDEEERRYELRPDEERQAHPGHPFRAQLNNRRDKINRAEKR